MGIDLLRAELLLIKEANMPKEVLSLKNTKKIAGKITRTLFISQSIVSAALITTGTVNSIAGAELSGVIAWAGFPTTVLLFSAALGALGWGLIMERIGRHL